MQRQWLSEEQFLDLVSAANLIPAPNSTELVIHIGLQRAGYAGMLVAGLCFIAPAMFSVLVLAAALLLPAVAAASALPFALPVLFLVFLKIGAVLYGIGYVLLAFLRADLVVRLGWITECQLLDAVAAGQLTPGPLFTSATFIGYLLGGLPGALLATLGIFLPAFIFVPLAQPLLPLAQHARRSGFAGRGECCFAWAAGCGGRAAGVGVGGRSGGRAAGCGSASAAFANADFRKLATAGRRAAGCAARRIVVGCCAGAGSAQAASIWPRHHELTRGACPNSQTKSRG